MLNYIDLSLKLIKKLKETKIFSEDWEIYKDCSVLYENNQEIGMGWELTFSVNPKIFLRIAIIPKQSLIVVSHNKKYFEHSLTQEQLSLFEKELEELYNHYSDLEDKYIEQIIDGL